MQTCRAITQRGERCSITSALSDDGLCLWHDPNREEAASAARLRGGHPKRAKPPNNDGPPPAPESLEDLVRWTSWIIQQTASGAMDHSTARSLTYSLSTCKVMLSARDLGGQVRTLQRQVKQLRRAP